MDAIPELAGLMDVKRIGDGVFRVEINGRAETVYVAGTPDDRWAFWNGRVFHGNVSDASDSRVELHHRDGRQSLTAPMPATVLKVLVAPGTHVKRGETLLILEAMKMELPLRSASDATVTAIHCREGELVQPDAVLVELS